MKSKKITILPIGNSISRWPWRRGLLFIALALCCFALSPAPKAFGVTPAPDGGYPNRNTAEGDSALFSLTTGANNTSSVSMLNYSNLFTGFNFGIGSAMSVLILICVAIIAVLFIRGFGTAAPGSSLQR